MRSLRLAWLRWLVRLAVRTGSDRLIARSYDRLVDAEDLGVTTAYELVTGRLAEVTSYAATHMGAPWRCPAHDDRNPSLVVTAAADKVVLYCHSGCSVNDVVAALGLAIGDLFDKPGQRPEARPEITSTYDYVDEEGSLLYQVVRLSPKAFRQRRPDGNGGWIWSLGETRRVLYRLPEVLEAVRSGRTVYVCEGEKDVDALVRAGAVATCNPAGAGKWRSEFTETLTAAPHVVVVADRDRPGYRHARQVAEALTGKVGSVEVVEAVNAKDAADHLAAGFTLGDLGALSPEMLAELCEDGEPGDDIAETTWREVGLGDIIAGLVDGTRQAPQPTLGRRSDGTCLFYAGRVNALYGESGDGKTWAALAAAGQEIAAGRHIIWIDLEDTPDGIVGRLLALGAHPDTIRQSFHYVRPDEPFGTEAEQALLELIDACRPSGVIIDSTGEALAIEGVKPNADEEVARWMRRLPRLIADRGPAVLLVDHVTKSREDRGLFAIGSQRKRAAINGAAYMVEVLREFGKDRAGKSKLTVAKDRCGTFVRGTKAAEFVLDATTTPYTYALNVPTPSLDENGTFRPTTLMERVSRHLELNPNLTKNAIKVGVKGSREHIVQAIDLLIDEGHISTEPGPNRAAYHRVVNPFRADEQGAEK